jgi:hypothetical protein
VILIVPYLPIFRHGPYLPAGRRVTDIFTADGNFAPPTVVARVRIKTFFWGRQMIYSFFCFFCLFCVFCCFFAVFLLFIAFFCSFVRFFAPSCVFCVSRVVALLHPAPICCAPAARRSGPESRPLTRSYYEPEAVHIPPKSRGYTNSGPHLLNAAFLLLTSPTASLVSRIVKHARLGDNTTPASASSVIGSGSDVNVSPSPQTFLARVRDTTPPVDVGSVLGEAELTQTV